MVCAFIWKQNRQLSAKKRMAGILPGGVNVLIFNSLKVNNYGGSRVGIKIELFYLKVKENFSSDDLYRRF